MTTLTAPKKEIGVLLHHFNVPTIQGEIRGYVDRVVLHDKSLIILMSARNRESPNNALPNDLKQEMVDTYVKDNYPSKPVTISNIYNQKYLSDWFRWLKVQILIGAKVRDVNLQSNHVVVFYIRHECKPWFDQVSEILDIDCKVKYLYDEALGCENIVRTTCKPSNNLENKETARRFRAGAMYANMNRTPVVLTRIILLVYDYDGKILVTKEKDQTYYYLPEANIAVRDKSLEAAAKDWLSTIIREPSISSIRYLSSFRTDDDWTIDDSGDTCMKILLRVKLTTPEPEFANPANDCLFFNPVISIGAILDNTSKALIMSDHRVGEITYT